MSNVKNAPLFMQPDVVLAMLTSRPANRAVNVPVLGKINGGEKPRLSIGQKVEQAPIAMPDPAARLARVSAAIAFLKTQGILAQVVDRNAQLRTYRCSGSPFTYLPGDVIRKAQRMGWEG